MERSEKPNPTKPNPKALRAYERLMHHRKVLTKPDTDEEEPFDHDLMEFLEEVHRPKDEIPVGIAAETFLMHQMILNGEMDISAARKEELRASLIEARKSSQEKQLLQAEIKNISGQSLHPQ
ncbi:hypothetical protein L195_g034762 [Trifolium pratense]|uniref:Uncharacterized protein n=3 Tax=Trifolium pratense TaxID=57577 RepID=A0ACB0L8J4_TRIPR|nr:uncharacterized protein LOC123894844 [Trifolium pratense]XP_045811362.1 uncharacterized protein LOC123905701 [Trifolium pratense]PNX78781.1 hypothetical protein L195_g034762 [Trifolium pratense]CAJ2665713.1 unnamed protein product [Trifolium pratense]